VVVYHVLPLYFVELLGARGYNQDSPYYWLNNLNQPFVRMLYNGHYAVEFFFVLSGFLLSRRYFISNDLEYVAGNIAFKRYFRLMPAVLSTLLVSYGFSTWGAYDHSDIIKHYGLGTSWGYCTPHLDASVMKVTWGALFEAWTTGTDLFSKLNGPLWTLKMEFTGSFTAVALVLLMSHRVKHKSWILSTVTATCLYHDWPAGIGSMMVGVCVSSFAAKSTSKNAPHGLLWRWWNYVLKLICLMLIPVGAYLASIPDGGGDGLPAWRFPSLIIDSKPISMIPYYRVAAVIFILAPQRLYFLRMMLESRVLQWLGRISFMVSLLELLKFKLTRIVIRLAFSPL
jgi:peptidoglycan/LPS O-acetylase OafA/YrhL